MAIEHVEEHGADPATIPLPGTNEAMRRAKALMADANRRKN